MKLYRIAALALLLAGCSSTEYYSYQGSGQLIGQGGASMRMNNVDLWINGSPPRKFYILGYIQDVRPGGPGPMSMRNYRLTQKAHEAGETEFSSYPITRSIWGPSLRAAPLLRLTLASMVIASTVPPLPTRRPSPCR